MSQTFTPNLTDPRFIKRAKSVYGFSVAFLHKSKSKAISRTLIDKHFGQQQNPQSKWFRDLLLICVDGNYTFGLQGPSKPGKNIYKVKEYILNVKGAALLKKMLKGESVDFGQEMSEIEAEQIISPADNLDKFDREVVIQWAKREFPELQTLNFIYEEKADRLWHPLQNVRTQIREDIFTNIAGLTWNYDIEACAPTLILQFAQQNGMDEYCFAINKYLNSKKEIRQHIATIAGVDLQTAKVLINSLFNSARLGANHSFASFGLICKSKIDAINAKLPQDEQISMNDYIPDSDDAIRMIALKNDPFIIELRSDIKKCWDIITSNGHFARIKITDKNGRQRLLPVSSKQKWQKYFQLENKVMKVVKDYLNLTGNQFFLEHDGWRCKMKLETEVLSALVQEKTGFKIKFDEEEIKSDSSY